ncbi:MAG: hypothetical protein M3Y33_03930 [Actinomycetota bacterium]|nr:hypothetical protein [Actinomycetota bacterium]
MDSDGQLGLSCVERGWRYSQLDADTFFFDERTEYLARVDERIAGRLEGIVPDGSLSAVLRDLSERLERQTPAVHGAETVVGLTLLGVRVDVRCTSQLCAEAIGSFYSASLVSPQSSSPEVVVWCDLESPGRYLFRSRPDDMSGVPFAGVSVQTLRSRKEAWAATLPPIPALASWPFKDRFAALHAAVVRTAGGEGVLIAGDRGSGKSTAALLLADRLEAEVLCDETAFIHCRTRLAEPFPHAVGVWRDGRKVRVPITEVCTRISQEPVLVSRLVFLDHRLKGSGQVCQLTRSDALRKLLTHHRDAGASIGDAMQTLLNLAAGSEAWSVEYSRYEELADIVCEVVGGVVGR